MGQQSLVMTLGQCLQQTRKTHGLTLQQVAARVHHKDGRPISYKYLQLLERDQRRPSVHVATQLATVLALDLIHLLTLAHLTDAIVQQYLRAWPEAERGLTAMLLQAEKRGFVAWEWITRRLVAPDPPSAVRRRPRATRLRTRRPRHIHLIQRLPERPDHQ